MFSLTSRTQTCSTLLDNNQPESPFAIAHDNQRTSIVRRDISPTGQTMQLVRENEKVAPVTLGVLTAGSRCLSLSVLILSPSGSHRNTPVTRAESSIQISIRFKPRRWGYDRLCRLICALYRTSPKQVSRIAGRQRPRRQSPFQSSCKPVTIRSGSD